MSKLVNNEHTKFSSSSGFIRLKNCFSPDLPIFKTFINRAIRDVVKIKRNNALSGKNHHPF